MQTPLMELHALDDCDNRAETLDLTDEERARIHSPAGLDIGARTPQGIALSVFARMVSERPRVALPGCCREFGKPPEKYPRS